MSMIKPEKDAQPRVVTIGGGTGQSVLLSGLRNKPLRLTAVVTMADDGSSSGILRDELGVLPPGDVRMCLVALSSAPDTMRELFQYRFESGNISGHTLGNLLLSALEKVTGSFSHAVATAGKILQVYGRVVPVSEEDMRLLVELKDGTVLRGEQYLNDNEEVRMKGVKNVTLERQARASALAIEAIQNADMIILGPGGLWDSIVPNLLVDGIADAIRVSKARVLYIANLTNKMGQTEHFTLADYIRELDTRLGGERIDMVLVNTKIPDAELLARYEGQEGKDTLVKDGNLSARARFSVIGADLLADDAPAVNKADKIAKSRSLIRHDAGKLGSAVAGLLTK